MAIQKKILVAIGLLSALGIISAIVIPVVVGRSHRASGKDSPITAEKQDLRLRTATRMIDEGKLNAEGIIRIKAKLESDLDRTDGKQLTSYAGFLWAASEEPTNTNIETRQGYFNEGMAALEAAETRGWTKAFFVDGSWRGQHSSISTTAFLGENDPRSQTWPILEAVTKWQEGATKGDSSCRFIMDNLAPAWGANQSALREVEELEKAFQANKKGRAPRESLKADLAAVDEAKMKWIINSGMILTHAVDHPQHSLPCWAWVDEKSGTLIEKWNQAHPEK
jgi:hypothetical protein